MGRGRVFMLVPLSIKRLPKCRRCSAVYDVMCGCVWESPSFFTLSCVMRQVCLCAHSGQAMGAHAIVFEGSRSHTPSLIPHRRSRRRSRGRCTVCCLCCSRPHLLSPDTWMGGSRLLISGPPFVTRCVFLCMLQCMHHNCICVSFLPPSACLSSL
jgi:hypothetical protein